MVKTKQQGEIMELTKIVLHNEDGKEKHIKNLEWYSTDLVCYTYNNILEMGLMQYCVGHNKDNDLIDGAIMGAAPLIKILYKVSARVEPEYLEEFINHFMQGTTNNVVKN